MHSAPSVSYPVGRSVFLAALLVATATSGLLPVMVGLFYLSGAGASAAALLWGGCIAGSWWAWKRQVLGRLSWRAGGGRASGADAPAVGTWSWISDAYRNGVALRRVERVYDLQGAMLLRLHNADGARTWVWVERRGDPARWLDLRRALMAHA